ncbi:MAG TPA: YciI family protein [Thermomicrobiaceae bacterium]|nr:YciI family protein [Thermomicrobiaceae bacterium]
MKYAAFIRYGNDSDQIATVRPKHREYLGSLKEQGKLALAGPFSDDSGALIIYEADSAGAARALIEADPFRQAGVFQAIELKEWRQVF